LDTLLTKKMMQPIMTYSWGAMWK